MDQLPAENLQEQRKPSFKVPFTYGPFLWTSN